MVGWCPFEPEEKRTARRGYSFERFRLLCRLNALRLGNARQERALAPEEFGKILGAFGKQKTLSYRTLRKLLDLDPSCGSRGYPLSRRSRTSLPEPAGPPMERTLCTEFWKALPGNA